jgi:hydroxyacylglutathione hydrolase
LTAAIAPVTRDVGSFRVTTLVTGGSWRVNCYLIRSLESGEQVLIDPGGDEEMLAQHVLAAGGPVVRVLLTHGHHDHVGAVAAVCRHFELPCDVHADEARLLRHAPMYAMRFAGRRIEDPRPIRHLATDTPIPFGGAEIGVVETPGHTPGSVCYVLPGVVFTGDTLLRESVGRTDLPGGDAATLAASVTSLLRGLAPDTLLLPGHGGPWSAGEASEWWARVADAPPELTAFRR